jgi:hypothetical protein
MAWGIYRLPKVSLRPAMPDDSVPCGWLPARQVAYGRLTTFWLPHAIRHPPHAIRHTPSAIRHTPSAIRHTPLIPSSFLNYFIRSFSKLQLTHGNGRVMSQHHGRMERGGHGLPKVSPGPAISTLLRPVGGPPLKQPYGRFRGGPPAGRAACGCLPPLWTPHAVHLSSPLRADVRVERRSL